MRSCLWVAASGALDEKESIKIRYTGLVAFATNLLGIVAGVLFIMIAVRRLTPQEFGSWQYIGSLLPYFTLFGAPINTLMTRFISRGIRASKTGLFLTLLISVGAFGLWFPVTWFISSSNMVPIQMTYFTLAGLQIFAIYFTDSLAAIATAHKPQLISYSVALSEVVKIGVAYLLMVQARLGLTGALLCTIITLHVRLIAILLMDRRYLVGDINREQTHRYLKLYWLPFYSMFHGRIQSLDVILVTTILMSTTPVGLYSSAIVVGTIIGYSYTLASGLYPSILRGGGPDDVEDSIRLLYMFSVPMVVGAMIMPGTILNVLRPEYVQASSTLIVVAISILLGGFSTIADTVLIGIEKADLKEGLGFSELMRSNLFRVPLIYYVNSVVYVVTFAVILSYMGQSSTPQTISTVWALTSLAVGLPFLAIRFSMSRKAMNYKVPLSSLAKYSICALFMAFVVAFLTMNVELPREVDKAIFHVLQPVVAGAAIYFLSLYAVDAYFRRLLKGVLRRLRPNLGILRRPSC